MVLSWDKDEGRKSPPSVIYEERREIRVVSGRRLCIVLAICGYVARFELNRYRLWLFDSRMHWEGIKAEDEKR